LISLYWDREPSNYQLSDISYQFLDLFYFLKKEWVLCFIKTKKMKILIILALFVANSFSCNNSKGWAKSEREKFVSDCVSEAQKSISNSEAKSYCACMLPKIEAKYPSYADANTKTQELTTDAWKEEIRKCLESAQKQ
jgi:hypothetical protein